MLNRLNNSDFQIRVFWFRKPEPMRAFGRLVIDATEAIIADRWQSEASSRWIRTSWNQIQHFRDGLTFDAQGMSPGMRALAKFLPPLTLRQTDRFWLAATRNVQVATASAFGVIAVLDSGNLHQCVEGGRLWQRMHLLSTHCGLAMQPLNQPLERRDQERQAGQTPIYARALSNLLQDDRWQPIIGFRLGFL